MKIVRPIDIPRESSVVLALQRKLAAKVIIAPGNKAPRYVAAADVSYTENTHAYAAVVVLDSHDLSIVDQATWTGVPSYPYLPGLFALREAACLLDAFKNLNTQPDVILIDGHGTAHPRQFGLACYIGLSLDVPTIGCAKTHLHGEYDQVGATRGDTAPVKDGEKVIGCVLRTQKDVNPVYVSPGHRYDFDTAAAAVLSVTPKYRIPEPLRQAHLLSIKMRAAAERPNQIER